MADFRFQGKSVALTYPQCPVMKENALEHLLDKFPIDEYFIAREKHEDGEWHLHMYLSFKERVRTRDVRAFDIGIYHPNIQTCKNKGRWLRYMSKEDQDPLTNMNTKELIWTRILHAASLEKAMTIIKEEKPRDFIMSAERIKQNLREVFDAPVAYESPYSLQSFRDCEPVREWFESNVLAEPKPDRWKVLILVGPTRLGKTRLVRAYGQHNYFAGQWTLDDYDERKQYTVYDDCDWTYIPAKKALLTGACSTTAVVTDKYRTKKTIKVLPTVWICNVLPDFGEEQEYWIGNTVIVSIRERLY